MKKVYQTRFSSGDGEIKGNCCSAVLASFLERGVDEVFDIHSTGKLWKFELVGWMYENGWIMVYYQDPWSVFKDFVDGVEDIYFVVGDSPRGGSHEDGEPYTHIVIYEKGEMVHDPHPDNTGVLNEKEFWYLKRREDVGLNSFHCSPPEIGVEVLLFGWNGRKYVGERTDRPFEYFVGGFGLLFSEGYFKGWKSID
jgi:hypothetical protein